tara:strand:+ start:24 stop:167 length:144 start_codon:yes stop_codon:yes gene_type:complete
VEQDVMTVHSDHEPNGEDTIPTWLWIGAAGLLLFTIICFLIMLAGML